MNQKRINIPFWRANSTTVWRVVFFLVLFLPFFILITPVKAATSPVVTGQVFSDLNVNGSADNGETGLADWSIKLLKNGTIIAETISDANGNYSILAPLNDTYSLEIVKLAGWEITNVQSLTLDLKNEKNIPVNFGVYQTVSDNLTLAPIITLSDVMVKVLSPTSAEITWFSNYKATGQIIYGSQALTSATMSLQAINFGYDKSSKVDFDVKTYHSIILTDLTPGSNFYFRVVSLPDPNQWHQAAYVITPEYIFTTPLVDQSKITDNSGKNNYSQKSSNQVVLNKYPGKVLSVEFEPTAAEILGELPEAMAEANDAEPSPAVRNCVWLIILLLILDTLAIVTIWYQAEKNGTEAEKKIWWMITILMIIPTILAYPECWLNFWLFMVLVFSASFLIVRNLKKRPVIESKPPDIDRDK